MTDYVPLGTAPRTHALTASMTIDFARRQNLLPQPVAPPQLDDGPAPAWTGHDTDLALAKIGVGSQQRFTQPAEPAELDEPDPRSFPAEHVRAISAVQRSRTSLGQVAKAEAIYAPRRSTGWMGDGPSPEYVRGRWNASGSDFTAADAASGAGTNKPRLVRF